MLNSVGTRELVYLTRVDEIMELPGYDRVESARIGGWLCIVPKGQFSVGDVGIYFEIDSLVPSSNPVFEFMAKRNYKVKTQKMCKSISQGLLMHPSDFDWISEDGIVIDNKGKIHNIDDETRFLTKELGVTYADPADTARKTSDPNTKYKAMCARHQKIFKKSWARWLMKREWGRKLMFFFFGKKKDKPNAWPAHIAAKTDVERIQNCIYVLKDKKPYVATEKVDGSSCSVMCERTKFGKLKYYVCSRNVVFKDENQKCFYEDNIYFEAYQKYNLREIITQIMEEYNLPNVAIQMEIFGDGIQRRNYSMTGGRHEIRVFHIVSNGCKFRMDDTVAICEKYGLPHVHVVDDNYILPDTIEELQKFVEGAGSAIDGLPREGIVFYDKETGQQYFKFVSPSYLLKYHG